MTTDNTRLVALHPTGRETAVHLDSRAVAAAAIHGGVDDKPLARYRIN